MKTIQILDKEFALSIPECEIQSAIDAVAKQINRDLAGKNPLFLSILNGAFMYTADLMKRIEIPCQISFIKMASYASTKSTGRVTELIGLDQNLLGRTVVVVEDIVDSGLTMKEVVELLKAKGAAEVRVSTLLFKPNALKYDVPLHYVALRIPNDFIVGYGLDYDGYGRNTRDIYSLVK